MTAPEDLESGPLEPGPLESGTVSWYSAAKGFGFITPADGGPDVVFYPETLRAAGIETPAMGAAVAFTAEPFRRARKATSIHAVEPIKGT